jgi:4-amino-4-deoxy-L-arabinose transferase-like glycosyltransferase
VIQERQNLVSRPLNSPVTAGAGLALTRRVAAVSPLIEEYAAQATLAIALVGGAALRLWRINSAGFNSDEAVYAGQAAALAGDPELSRFFPIFRAHPMLFQFLLSIMFRIHVSDVAARVLVVAIGLATICLVYKLGAFLYGRPAGAIAALLIAVMPYHVIVTRQVLLDGPLTLCTTPSSP